MQSSWQNIKWPKTVSELHVHLGGSVPLHRLWEIAISRGIRGLGDGYEEFVNILKRETNKIKDLDSYLEIYDKVELIQSGPAAVAESIIIAIHRAYLTGGLDTPVLTGGEELKPLFNISQLELRFNPLKRTGAVFLKEGHTGLYDVDRIISSACSVIEDVEIGFKNKIKVGLIFCFGRDMAFEANQTLAEKVNCWAKKEPKIIGVDLAGPESVNPLDNKEELLKFKELFDSIPSSLGKTIHVGETHHISLDTFISTVEQLNPQRVAHPVVAYRSYRDNKDDRGLKLLAERDITCELCVKSNLLTKAISSLEEYGDFINTLDKFNVPYCFSTDAPSLQVSTLASEIKSLYLKGLISQEQILRSFEVANDRTFLN